MRLVHNHRPAAQQRGQDQPGGHHVHRPPHPPPRHPVRARLRAARVRHERRGRRPPQPAHAACSRSARAGALLLLLRRRPRSEAWTPTRTQCTRARAGALLLVLRRARAADRAAVAGPVRRHAVAADRPGHRRRAGHRRRKRDPTPPAPHPPPRAAQTRPSRTRPSVPASPARRAPTESARAAHRAIHATGRNASTPRSTRCSTHLPQPRTLALAPLAAAAMLLAAAPRRTPRSRAATG